MNSIRLLKIIKVAVILAFLYFVTSSFFNWLADDSKEIKELIKQGYLPSDYQHEDIYKLCNPETDEEAATLEKAPNYFWTCMVRGGWT